MEDHRRKIKVAELLGQRFLKRRSKIVDEDSHSTDLSVAGEEGHSTILLSHYVFWSKMFRNLTLLYNLHILASDPKKFLFFSSNFEQLSWQKATFERLFEKLQETFWKIACNLWKVLVTIRRIICEHLFKAVFSSYFSWPMLKIIVKNEK